VLAGYIAKQIRYRCRQVVASPGNVIIWSHKGKAPVIERGGTCLRQFHNVQWKTLLARDRGKLLALTRLRISH